MEKRQYSSFGKVLRIVFENLYAWKREKKKEREWECKIGEKERENARVKENERNMRERKREVVSILEHSYR